MFNAPEGSLHDLHYKAMKSAKTNTINEKIRISSRRKFLMEFIINNICFQLSNKETSRITVILSVYFYLRRLFKLQ